MEAIRLLEERLRAAMLASDLAELDALLADDLLVVGPDGHLGDKAGDLAAHRSGQVRMQTIEPLDMVIKPMANAVVVFALIAVGGTFAGQTFAGQYRYTRIWTQQTGSWQIRAAHISPVPSDE